MKKTNFKTLFLAQSYSDSYDSHIKAINNEMAIWDYIVLTASNDSQKMAYLEQINYRLSINVLPSKTKYLVVADRDGKRCGSGGATLTVLKEIAKKEKTTDFSKLKILCIHSGGDGKRVPQYSACGKIFSPVPRILPDGRNSTLFDEFVIAMSGIPARIKNGMLVCSGDVLLLFNSLQLDFYQEGAAALSIKEDVETGKDHGVFLGGEDGFVKKCLQKQTVKTLTKVGAVDKNKKVDIDTGAVILSGGLVNSLYTLVNTNKKYDKYVNDKVRLSFYADFLYPLAEDSTLEDFYKEKPEGEFSLELKNARKAIWKALNGYKMKLIRFSPSMFLHFGTTQELLDLLTVDIDSYKFIDWKKINNSNCKDSKISIYNSYVGKNNDIGEGTYLENADILTNVKVGKRCILSGVTAKDIVVKDETVLHGLKLDENRYVCRMYSIYDNPKENKWFDKELDEPLWTKPLFKVCPTMIDAVKATLKGDTSGELLSLKDSFNLADVTSILPFQRKLDDKIIAESIIEMVDNNVPVDEVIKKYPNGISERVEKYIIDKLDLLDDKVLTDFSKKVRVLYYTSKLVDTDNLSNKCFETISNAVYNSVEKDINYNSNKIKRENVTISLPVRVNWGGGWSDTPPYCMEHGGNVLNSAITLNGIYPIEVTIKKTDKFTIVLSSTDIGCYKEFTDIDELVNCKDPSDAFALHKATLLACGVIPINKSKSVKEICETLGGGIYLNTRVINIPKGSGLGTSSILAGAAVKAVYQFLGKNDSDDAVFSRVLLLEQLMSTGGGWQDQVGGIVSGIKLCYSNIGLDQKIKYKKLNIKDETLKELNDRFIIIYTGQRRLARNLLREVVGKYLGNDANSLYVLDKIKQIANEMSATLEKGNIDEFAKLMNEHWSLSKRLDKGCTNTCIDQILLSIKDLISGQMICGAGGGGYLQVILKKGVTREKVDKRIKDVFADSGVCTWNCEFVK